MIKGNIYRVACNCGATLKINYEIKTNFTFCNPNRLFLFG